MEYFLQSMLFAARSLWKHRAVTVPAILILALGIGSSTAMFSILHGVLLLPLPYEDESHIVAVSDSETGDGPLGSLQGVKGMSYPNFRDVYQRTRSFEALSFYSFSSTNLDGGAELIQIRIANIGPEYFRIFRTEPLLGRLPSPNEYASGDGNVVVLGEALWRQQFHADRSVVGRAVTLDSEPATVIGVLAESFAMPEFADLWRPNPQRAWMENRSRRSLLAFGKLRGNVKQEDAQRELGRIWAELERDYPKENRNRVARVANLRELIVGDVQTALWLLFGAVGLVLLIATANVAGLLLARAVARRRELSIRAALGASRMRIFGQFVAESLVLALISAGFALIATSWVTEPLLALAPDNVPRMENIGIGPAVYAFTFGAVVLIALFCGLIPALRHSLTNTGVSLHESGRSASAGRDRQRLRSALVVGEVALAFVLLVASGLMIRTLNSLLQVDLGFEPDRILNIGLVIPQDRGLDRAGRADYLNGLLERLRRLPGVEVAAAGNFLPLSGNNDVQKLGIPGRTTRGRMAEEGQESPIDVRIVTPGYFRALGIPVLRGRTFKGRDSIDAPPVAVLNAEAAERYWGTDRAVGDCITLSGHSGDCIRVIGISGNVRHNGLRAAAQPEVFISHAQYPALYMNLAIRPERGDPEAMINTVRAAVSEVDKALPVFSVAGYQRWVEHRLGRPRFVTLLLAVFAGMALLLAAAGIYGLLAYTVSQQTKEIGIRMALGSPARAILTRVLRSGLTLTALGAAFGIPASLWMVRWIESELYGVSTTDPVTFALISLVLMTTALLACALPTYRSLKVDPVVALRQE